MHPYHPPFSYTHTIDTQWPPATGSLPSSSPYRWPSPTVKSAYEGGPNVSGGHTPTVVITPSFRRYHDGPNWGQPNPQLPTSLREIIETSPKRSIKISANNDMSFMNRTKGIIETYTAIQWDWWPLAPRVPDVAPDRLRLEWRVSRRSPGTYCMLTR